MKEELKQLMQKFLEETDLKRTEYSVEHDILMAHEPTFMDFINWLKDN